MTKQFKVIVEQDEDGFLVASVPALPGCHTQARTLGELKTRVKEAIALCFREAKNNLKYQARIKAMAYEPSFVGLEMVEL